MAKIRLDTFSGFSDELKKIANIVMESSTTTQNAGSTLKNTAPTTKVNKPKLPKLVSKPQPATNFDPAQDHLRSMKATPSPQVTQ